MKSTLSTVRGVVSGAIWAPVMAEVADAFSMDAEEAQRFLSHPIARHIAALPFLAEAAQPGRTAAAHLGVYVLSVRNTRSRFHATMEDDRDVFARLGAIAHFVGGDPTIIDRGMAILALNMVTDYVRDVALDGMLGKHNPVATGAWDADSVVSDLKRRIEEVSCPQMDEILNEGGGSESYWSW